MKKSIKRVMNTSTAIAVFMFVLARLFGFYMQDTSNPAVFESYGDFYISHWFIVESNIVALIFCLVLIERALRFRLCIYTKIATILCAAMSLSDLMQSIFFFNYSIYYSIVSLIMWIGICVMLAVFLLMPLLKRI